MNNQLPENSTLQDGLEKTENVFQFVKKSRISNWASWLVLGAVVLIAGGTVWWRWNQKIKIPLWVRYIFLSQPLR